MEPSAPRELTSHETHALLKDIIDELRNIGNSLARQDERIEELRRTKTGKISTDGNHEDSMSIPPPGRQRSFAAPSVPSTSGISISSEMRTGFILQEALTRYNLNAVPSWSSSYGTHVMRGEGPETVVDAQRNIVWTSVIGDCWRIPHDNRINFSFRGPDSDFGAIVRVRNFVSGFHRQEHSDAPKGEHFNVWDWFDTGISAYWYPGKIVAAAPLASPTWSPQFKEGYGNGYPLSSMIAPWRRIINMQGLTTLSLHDNKMCPDDFTDQDLCPFISQTYGSVFQEPMDEVLWRAIRHHLRCLHVGDSDHGAMETKGWVLFHVSFYEILQSNSNDKVSELWPCGELHSDHQKRGRRPRRIRESALTIIAIPSVDIPEPKARSIFWTMLCMRPQSFPHPHYSENRDDLSRGRTHEMLDEMSDLVHGSLLTVIGRWEQIANYFEGLLSERNGLLDPGYHDSLLTDDSAFTRSKKYFWAIEFLKEAESSISDNICQAQRFLDLLRSNPPTAEVARIQFSARLHKHSIALQKLEAFKKGFRNKQDEAKALRDGLFSASAVMESRAATLLGQNIKLLTYVSIFFLPISICTSFWSVNDSIFSLSALATVVPIVALSTYVIVLNLDTIIQFISSTCVARYGDRPHNGPMPRISLQNIASKLRELLQVSDIWKRSRPTTSEELMGNLGDVRVHYQVDVNVEDVQAETEPPLKPSSAPSGSSRRD